MKQSTRYSAPISVLAISLIAAAGQLLSITAPAADERPFLPQTIVTSTVPENGDVNLREHVTAFRMRDVAATFLNLAKAKKVIVIRDCCFSGSAVDKWQSNTVTKIVAEKTLDSFPGFGTALLVAALKKEPAVTPDGAEYTMFSEAFLHALTAGIPGKGDLLTLRDVGERAADFIKEKYGLEGVRPEVHSPRQVNRDVASTGLFPNRTPQKIEIFESSNTSAAKICNRGHTVLITEENGEINWPSEKGLYFFDTRTICSWNILVNGEPWELLSGNATNYCSSRIFLGNRAFLTEDGTIPPRTLGLTLSRSINGGMHEDLDITNNSMRHVRFQLEIALRCDFADIFEVKAGRIVRRGHIATEWSKPRQHLRLTYRNGDFTRAVKISAAHSSTKAVYTNGRLCFESYLAPGEAWHSCLLYTLSDGNRHLAAPTDCTGHNRKSRPDGGLAKKSCQYPD